MNILGNRYYFAGYLLWQKAQKILLLKLGVLVRTSAKYSFILRGKDCKIARRMHETNEPWLSVYIKLKQGRQGRGGTKVI